MGLKAAGADLAFKGGLLAGSKYVGLIDSSDAEFSGNSYARVALTGFGAGNSWQADGESYENINAVTFPQPTGGAWPGIAKWGLYTAATSGSLLLDVDVNPDTAAPQIGADVSAAAEALAWGFTGITDAGALVMMSQGLFSGTRQVTLHTGDPGTTGASVIFTDGVVWNGSNQGSKTVLSVATTAGNWTLNSLTTPNRRQARNNVVLNYGAQAADLPDPTFLALRDGTAVDSTVLWSGALSASDPGLGATIRFLANNISIRIATD